MLVIEFMKDNFEHLDCNAGILAQILSHAEQEPIHIFCGDSHFKNLKQKLDNYQINTSKLVHHKIIPIGKIIRDYSHFTHQLKIIKNIVDFSIKNNESNILFLYTTPFSLYFLKVFCTIYKSINIKTIIHSELEKIDLKEYLSNTPKNKFQVFFYVLLFGIRNPLKLPTPKNLKYVVYGKSIKNNLIKILPEIENSVIDIPLPTLYNYNIAPKSIAVPLKFGVIGQCSKAKNSSTISKLLKELTEMKVENFQIVFTGYITDELLFKYLQNSQYVDPKHVSNSMVSDYERNKLLAQIDYALFTYKLNSYKYTASGALIDAINFEKPIIALSNDYVKSYFDIYGNIGYLCNSYEELKNKIITITKSFPKEEYEIQVKNIQNIKKMENLKNIPYLF
ncbi:hypothetical protein KID03_09190 [bacterium]|nr:hypothetical protein [bacterium]